LKIIINQKKASKKLKKTQHEGHGNMIKTLKLKQQQEEIMKLKLILNENLMIRRQVKVILKLNKKNKLNFPNSN